MIENLGEYFYIVPKNHVEEVGNEAFGRQPVGTGPYKFISRRIKETIELEAFKEHWGRVPEHDNLTLRIAPDGQSRVAILNTGQAEIPTNLTPHLPAGTEAAPDTTLANTPPLPN